MEPEAPESANTETLQNSESAPSHNVDFHTSCEKSTQKRVFYGDLTIIPRAKVAYKMVDIQTGT